MEVQTKKCGKCGETKSLIEFHYRGARKEKDGSYHRNYYSPCKKCVSKQRQHRRHTNPDWRLHEIVRDLHGITGEQYKQMCKNQNNICAICGNSETAKNHPLCPRGDKRRLAVDHDHETGKIRALLCDGCNKGLGCFKDDIAVLESAIVYLKSHS